MLFLYKKNINLGNFFLYISIYIVQEFHHIYMRQNVWKNKINEKRIRNPVSKCESKCNGRKMIVGDVTRWVYSRMLVGHGAVVYLLAATFFFQRRNDITIVVFVFNAFYFILKIVFFLKFNIHLLQIVKKLLI